MHTIFTWKGSEEVAKSKKIPKEYRRLSKTPRQQRRSKIVKITMISIFGAFAMSVAIFMGVFASQIKLPDFVEFDPNQYDPGSYDVIEESDLTDWIESNSKINTSAFFKNGTYTFLLIGADMDAYNTDTLLVATFDTEAKTMNIMSVPRDTLRNAPVKNKKINACYASGGFNEKGINFLKACVSEIVGFPIQYHIFVKLNGFVKLVDAVDGVDFYVPQNMSYYDPVQKFSINLKQGQQKLSGKKALELVRFRATYVEGDIKRITVQQDFLNEAAKQILKKIDIFDIPTLADIAINNVTTNVSLNNLIAFAQKAMGVKAENIEFVTLPGNYYGEDWVPYKNKLLELVNEKFNPYESYTITADNVNIISVSVNAGK